MSANSTTNHPETLAERRVGLDLPRGEYPEGPSDQCHSTEAVIKHSEDDGEEEVTSKMTPSPKKTLWGVVNQAFNAVYAICMSKAIMDIYDDAGEIGSTPRESERDCFNRGYVELTAMENAKEYLEAMAKF